MCYSYLPLDADSQYTNNAKNTQLKSNDITLIEAIPHHVLIVYSSYYCSGSLIRSQIVVTAASCFAKRKRQQIIVKVGVNTITEPGQIIPVEELKLHEYFNHLKSWENDIALLALKHHVDFSSKAKKILLVEPDTLLRPGTSIETSGYANLSLKFKNNLLLTKMTVINKENCQRYHKENLITSTNYCAIYNEVSEFVRFINDHKHRLNDNGGAAVYKDLLVGILSFGATNKDGPVVAVFTNVSYFHRWITLNSKRLLEKYCQRQMNDYYDAKEYSKDSSMD